MLPSQASVLQRLSSLQGRDFDVLYVSVEKDGLRRLETVYQDFVQNGADPGLHAIAAQELPEVKQLIAALGGL
jgi:predicted outer membrane protein